MGQMLQRVPEIDYEPSWFDGRIDGEMGSEELEAARKTMAHADTPNLVYFDLLGRETATLADNRKLPTESYAYCSTYLLIAFPS
jgi:hypothetical protein